MVQIFRTLSHCRSRRSGAASTEGEIETQLLKSQQVLRRLRWRIGCLWVAVGLVWGLGFEVLCLLFRGLSFPDDWWVAYFSHLLLRALYDFRFLMILLAPEDDLFVRGVATIDVAVACLSRLSTYMSYGLGKNKVNEWLLKTFYAQPFLCAVFLVWAWHPTAKGKIYGVLVWIIKAMLLACIVEKTIWFTNATWVSHEVDARVGELVPDLTCLWVLLRPKLQRELRQNVWRVLQGRAISRGAAGIACLMGRCQPSEVVVEARSRFKVVSFDAMSFELLQNKSPDPKFSTLAVPHTLGGCDAFLSHSWHDAGCAKWAAMQTWRTSFVAQYGREPSVWFDKCCIDQTRIDADLRCLPVFLMGCSRLVVFCGPTYLSRLWCILELFTYVHIGGNTDDIEFVPVLREGFESEDLQIISESFANFDASDCRCFNEEDRQRMLTMVRIAYGSMDAFNLAVKAIAANIGQHNSHSSV